MKRPYGAPMNSISRARSFTKRMAIALRWPRSKG